MHTLVAVSLFPLAGVHRGGYSWREARGTTAVSPPGLGPQPFCLTANGALTKVLPVQLCCILSHSGDISLKAKLGNSTVCVGLGNTASRLLGVRLEKVTQSP